MPKNRGSPNKLVKQTQGITVAVPVPHTRALHEGPLHARSARTLTLPCSWPTMFFMAMRSVLMALFTSPGRRDSMPTKHCDRTDGSCWGAPRTSSGMGLR